MANIAATKFVKDLAAAYSSQWPPISKETLDIYIEKISKWHLAPHQWREVLDKIITERPDKYIPTLVEIYGYFRAEIEKANRNDRKYGRKRFISPSKQPSGEPLVTARLVMENGKLVYLPGHKYAGKPPVLPPDSIILNENEMEDPAPPKEYVSPQEVAEIIAQTMAKIGANHELLANRPRISAGQRVV